MMRIQWVESMYVLQYFKPKIYLMMKMDSNIFCTLLYCFFAQINSKDWIIASVL